MNYFLYGNDSYLLKRELYKILNAHNCDELSVTYYDASDKSFSLEQVMDDANTFPMFSDSKVIIVKNPIFLTSQGSLEEGQFEVLESYLKTPFSMTNLVFYSENLQIDSRKKTFKLLQKLCRNLKIENFDTVEMGKMIREDIRKEEIDIEQNALDELITRIPTDIQAWRNELNKLKLFENKIYMEDIAVLVPKAIEDDIFLLVNVVLKKDLSKAIAILEDLLIGKRDQVEMISILASQFRLMYQCASFLCAHRSEREIVSELKIHPYRVKKAIEACRSTTIDVILALLSALADLDQKIKSGKIEKALGFELFLIKATR